MPRRKRTAVAKPKIRHQPRAPHGRDPLVSLLTSDVARAIRRDAADQGWSISRTIADILTYVYRSKPR